MKIEDYNEQVEEIKFDLKRKREELRRLHDKELLKRNELSKIQNKIASMRHEIKIIAELPAKLYERVTS